jgi:HEAT repeat protein
MEKQQDNDVGAWVKRAQVGEREAFGHLARGLSQLSGDQRAVLVLHYWEGLSYDEIARFLDVPAGTVMSRLHRARRALQRVMERAEEGVKPVVPGEEFREIVEAEIDVLLYMSEEEAGEKLAAVVERDPGRFARLIVQTEDRETLARLVLLVQRLGRPALKAGLDFYFAGSESEKALLFLRQAMGARVANLRQTFKNSGGGTKEAYLLLDELLAGSWERRAKVELLMELVDACWATKTLCLNVLMSYADVAYPLLLERFLAAARAEDLPDWIAAALGHTGTPFCRALLTPLRQDDENQLKLALAGVNALLFESGERPEGVTQLQVDLDRRLRFSYTELKEPLDPAVFAALAAAVAVHLDDARPGVRDAAIHALARIDARAYLDRLRHCLGHEALSTRTAAMVVLGAMQDVDSVDLIIERIRNGVPSERLTAVHTLGHLRAHNAFPVLLELTRDDDADVRQAAIVVLGDIGGEEARAVLEKLLKSSDRKLQKTAAQALYGTRRGSKKHFRQEEPPTRADQLRQKRLKRMRGDARPQYLPGAFGIMLILPEIRLYEEEEITRLIAQLYDDWTGVRRSLVESGILARESGIYRLTDSGEAMWRVEHFIMENYLNGLV